ncbi:hypothetical protein JOF28_000993 [Leucobacter exalbidus]|uniref:DUF4232 domain-containing protein n=1 Tax=Leucobacter exalbidus TaxID=662960 RepID=A0A940PV22_9MICO|nr:hypothetical protein [Leucobacter exalbidus]MBP1325761.1 hypothetical protein [Leucobacter exalbidus]
MPSFREPVGSKPASVYVMRRLIVLAALIAFIAVVVLVIVRPGSNSDVTSGTTVDVPTDLAAQTADTSLTDTGKGKKKDKNDVAACQAGQLQVLPVTDDAAYAAGENPQLSLKVRNTGGEACSADLGTAGMELTVSSGNDQVWRSKDCQADATTLAVIIDPDQTLETDTITWDRTRSSAETCGDGIPREAVGGDGASYHLRAVAAGVQGSGTAQFLLY